MARREMHDGATLVGLRPRRTNGVPVPDLGFWRSRVRPGAAFAALAMGMVAAYQVVRICKGLLIKTKNIAGVPLRRTAHFVMGFTASNRTRRTGGGGRTLTQLFEPLDLGHSTAVTLLSVPCLSSHLVV